MIKVRPHNDKECIWNNNLWTTEGECTHCGSCCKFGNFVCMYLTEDNKCSIYEKRPKVCSEFPYNMMPKILFEILRRRKVLPLKDIYKDCPIILKLTS